MDIATIEGPDPTCPAFVIRLSREVDGVDLRVCLSEASYAATEKAEMENGVKNLKGSKAIPKYMILVFHRGKKDANCG